jgi:hypothetical protein
MAYTAPTAATIKVRFPEFAAVDDDVITSLISEAGRYVDETWIEGDYTLAVSLWVAHQLSCEGHGTSAASKLAAVGTFQRIKSGDLEVSTGANSSGGNGGGVDSQYQRTNYGQRWLEMRARSFPTPTVL